MVKNEEWEDILKPSQDESLEIPTLKELLSEMEQKETYEETTTLTDEEESDNEENKNTEGTTPAIELP